MPTNERPLRTDAEVDAIIVGQPELLDSEIVLADYDPEWPSLFRVEQARIRSVLGEHALLVEHVGSTSVPGLPAKPRIDIVLTVVDSAAEASYVPALEKAGYVLRVREPEWHEHRCFIGPDIDANLHVFSDGCLEVDRMLGFRDHLRGDVDDRARYEQTKRSLASQRWKYTQHYADAKSDVVEQILVRAGIGPLPAQACPGANS
jgi:GrpB-like predicted nucleotidyltransferase (UPF0157 family)